MIPFPTTREIVVSLIIVGTVFALVCGGIGFGIAWMVL